MKQLGWLKTKLPSSLLAVSIQSTHGRTDQGRFRHRAHWSHRDPCSRFRDTIMMDTPPGLEIPIVDFKPFLQGSTHDRQLAATSVNSALSSVGFFYLQNHGIEQMKIDRCFELVCLNSQSLPSHRGLRTSFPALSVRDRFPVSQPPRY